VLREVCRGYATVSKFINRIVKEKEKNMQGKRKWFPRNSFLWREWYG
jgi:hypothetical protein